jgi:hypothetical protein
MMSRRSPLILAAIAGGLLVLAALIQQPAGPLNAAPSGLATTVILNPIQDATVDQGAPDTNFGSSDLHVGTRKDGDLYRMFTYLKFDVSGIPSGADIAYATLRLYQQSASGPDPYWVWSWSAASAWSEGSITWNNQPWAASPQGATIGLTPAQEAWFEWDVSAIVEGWIVGGNPAYGIVLSGDNTTVADHIFDSRTGKAAQLEIEYTAAATATPTATATGTKTLTPTLANTPTVTPSPTATATETPAALFDLGDAPDSSNSLGKAMDAYPGVQAHFPTVYGSGSPPYGPRHGLYPLRFFLGTEISGEEEADTGADADGVHNIGPTSGTADKDGSDDGLELGGVALAHCKPVVLTFHVTSASAEPTLVYANLWADWNRNGGWGDLLSCDGNPAAEWAVQNQELHLPGAGTYTFTTPEFRVYNADPSQAMWLRITVSEQPLSPVDGSGPAGGLAAGETEDYLIAGAASTPTATATQTATPTATSTPTRTPTPTATTPPSVPDIRITGMEITQGLQNLDNEMPLERWRETRVRAYIFSANGFATGVQARLRAFRPEGVELSGSPIRAEWPVSTHAGALVRTNLTDAFYFYVPMNWREGQVRFRLEVNPDHLVPESNYGNNTYDQSVRFWAGSHDLGIKVRPFDGRDMGGGWQYDVRDPLIQTQTLQSLRRYFPTVRVLTLGDTDPLSEPFWCSFHGGYGLDGWGCMQDRTWWWYAWSSDDFVRQHYVGMVHPNVDSGDVGGLGNTGGQNLSVKVFLTNGPEWYSESGGNLAHEMGHNLGLYHVNCAGSEDWHGQHPEWIEVGYPWPFPNCRLAPVDPWGYYGLDIQHAVASRPGPTVLTNDPNGPAYNRAWPLMGYTTPHWISPWEL